MSTPGDEHATTDSRASDGDDIATGEIIENLTPSPGLSEPIIIQKFEINWPQQRIELQDFWHDLAPESANRILNMVEREKQYEEQTLRLEFLSTVLGRLASVTGIVAVIAGLVFIGLHSESPQVGLFSASSFVAGGAFVYATLKSSSAFLRLNSRGTSRSRDNETSDDSRQDVR
jgi:uncharacterized membrane protein